jgi:hypothetical protein
MPKKTRRTSKSKTGGLKTLRPKTVSPKQGDAVKGGTIRYIGR